MRTLKRCKNRFHVFKDISGASSDARRHTQLMSDMWCESLPNRCVQRIAKLTTNIFNFFRHPVCFMYRQSEIDGTSQVAPLFDTDREYINRFEIESERYAPALRTTYALPNSRIGLIGLCKNVRYSDCSRAWNKSRLQVIRGIAKVILGTVLTFNLGGILPFRGIGCIW